MDLDTFRQLLTPDGAAALTRAAALTPTDATFLFCFEKVRKHHPAELAKAAVETVILRAKARDKFPHAERMFFTREALEQASAWPVSTHRARRFARFGTVADLGCGIGADALALATVVPNVVAIDRDPLRAAMAAANALETASIRVELGDVLLDPIPTCDAAFCDPARRADGKRFLSVADYTPPPAAVVARFPAGFPIAFKLAPGVPHADLDGFDGEAEFVSLGGELKECVLWLGPFRTVRRRATVLPTGASLTADVPLDPPVVTEPQRFVLDPDPAVTRSGLLPKLAAEVGASLLDDRSVFLTSDRFTPTPFAAGYEVEASLPYHAKRLNEVLRQRDVGRVTPVRHGSDLSADDLMKRLKLTGGDHRFVLLTEVGGRPHVLVARRVAA